MAKRARSTDSRSPRPTYSSNTAGPVNLPRKALDRIHLGQSFAEYDTYLTNPQVYVQTAALKAASDHDNPHCFFVGRRGTGKTATTRYLQDRVQNLRLIRPEIFSPSSLTLPLHDFADANQKPFRSLIAAFKRALVDEILLDHFGKPSESRSIPDFARKERERYGDMDFDIRVLHFIASYTRGLQTEDDIAWLTEMSATKSALKAVNNAHIHSPYTIVLDAIDDFWDGSQQAVLYLTALMHAALEVNTQAAAARVLIFLRENIFERVRVFDSEFSRLETCVVGLDWTPAQLVEMIERRINAPLNSKLALGGTTWNAFFEDGDHAKELILEYCQHRPRDVLTYCTLALDNAQGSKHSQVMIEDLQDARRRFSDSRLKDLSDEYQENYPQIAVVLESFYGLGTTFTINAMEDFLNKLLDDTQVVSSCKEWIYEYSTVDRFTRLLYDIGFAGILDKKSTRHKAEPIFRSLGPRDTTPPPISIGTEVRIHPSYYEALDLQDVLVSSFTEGQKLRRSGMILELPGALNPEEYRDKVNGLIETLKSLPHGREGADAFEDLVGEVLRLCFYRPLCNIEAQVREIDGTIRRDWMASNRASFGFWEMARTRYNATQVIFECKNYSELQASDFQQAAYYLNDTTGRFIVIVFRGELKKHYMEHIKRTAGNNGVMLVLNEKDLNVFLRQARNGVTKDDHIQDRYDHTVRAIS
ncbi:P-loop ATPase, Sll1717 family [Mycobacterium sp. NPDC004974]